MGKRALVLLADGFEEVEAVAPIDLLRRAGVETVVAAVGDGLAVTGKNGITVHADALLSETDGGSFDALVLPGGPAAKSLRENETVLALVRSFRESDRLVGAICAAPTILLRAGILDGKRYTAHFSVVEDLPEILEEPVVRDGKIITSRGAGTAVEFGLALIGFLLGDGKAREVSASICAD